MMFLLFIKSLFLSFLAITSAPIFGVPAQLDPNQLGPIHVTESINFVAPDDPLSREAAQQRRRECQQRVAQSRAAHAALEARVESRRPRSIAREDAISRALSTAHSNYMTAAGSYCTHLEACFSSKSKIRDTLHYIERTNHGLFMASKKGGSPEAHTAILERITIEANKNLKPLIEQYEIDFQLSFINKAIMLNAQAELIKAKTEIMQNIIQKNTLSSHGFLSKNVSQLKNAAQEIIAKIDRVITKAINSPLRLDIRLTPTPGVKRADSLLAGVKSADSLLEGLVQHILTRDQPHAYEKIEAIFDICKKREKFLDDIDKEVSLLGNESENLEGCLRTFYEEDRF